MIRAGAGRGRSAGPTRVGRPWLDPRDLWTEALAGVLARPVRSALTTLGTVLGITTLVITIGVASTAGNQIVGRFDALTATSVTVTVPQTPPGQDDTGPLVDWSGTGAVRRLAGVESVAALADSATTNSVQVRSNDVTAPGDTSGQTLGVVATSAGLPDAVRGAMTTGRFFDAGDIARHDQVAVLGDQAARLLGIRRVEDAPAVFLRGQSYTVIGILGGIRRERQLSTAVLLPRPRPPRTGSVCATSRASWSTPRSARPGRWRARRRSPWRPGTRTRSPSWRRPICPSPATASRTTSTVSSSSSVWSRSWWARSASPT
ncbi:ABC transporter permease [Streptomyces sp. GLT-R25]